MSYWYPLTIGSLELAPFASSLIVESSRKLDFDSWNCKRGIVDNELCPGVSNIFLDPLSYSNDP